MDINSFQPTGDESKIEPSTATGIARGPFRLDGPGYLGSRPYLEYRAKPARGIGKDGEIVWSDEIEHAFQQGQFSLSRIRWSLPLTFWVLRKNSPHGKGLTAKATGDEGRAWA